MSFLEAQNVNKSYISGKTEREVLKGLEFEVKRGDMTLVIGPSGSGNTTLLNLLGGIDRADSDDISDQNYKEDGYRRCIERKIHRVNQ